MSLRLLLPCLVMAASLAAGPAPSTDPEAIRLVAQAAIGVDLAAFPRLGAADGPASQRINQALTKADARARVAAEECQTAAREAQADLTDAAWRRTVAVAMRGPGYLALVAADNWYCGGPYPEARSFALAYDLRTGAPMNWEKLLPKRLVQTAALDTAEDATQLGVVASPALKALYLKLVKPDSDCAATLQDTDLRFMLWPDAAREGVALQPSGLPHAIAVCGPDTVIPLATLRTLGAEPALLDAIAAGHRAGLYGPTP